MYVQKMFVNVIKLGEQFAKSACVAACLCNLAGTSRIPCDCRDSGSMRGGGARFCFSLVTGRVAHLQH